MPSWSTLGEELPAGSNMALPKWQAWIVAQVAAGNTPPLEWYDVTTRDGNAKAVFRVTNRIRIGDASDSVMPITSATSAQRIADLHDAVLPSALLYDHIADQGLLISYVSLTERNVADLTAGQMVENSRVIDARLAGEEYGLYEVGKSSIVSSRYNNPGPPGATGPTGLRNGRDTMINYGAALRGPAGGGNSNPWLSVSLPSMLRVWQPPGGTGTLWHHLDHVDISQKAPHMVHRSVSVSGTGSGDGEWDIDDLAAHPDLWRLVSQDGPIHGMRIPINGSAPTHGTPGKKDTGGARAVLVTALIAAGTIWALYRMS